MYVICLPTEDQGITTIRSEISVHSRIEKEFGNVGGQDTVSCGTALELKLPVLIFVSINCNSYQ